MEFDVTLFLEALTSQAFLKGAALALGLAFLAQFLGSVLGLGVALLRRSTFRPLALFALGYAWVFRALPVLLLLILAWNALPQIVPALRGSWYTPFLAALLALTAHETALMSEVFRSGLGSVNEGQRLAGRALGFAPAGTYRWIIMPQVIRTILPPLGNRIILQVQITSLTSVIAMEELMTAAQNEVTRTFRYAEFYSAAAVYYLAIVSALMLVQHYIERRYRWTSAKAAAQPKKTEVSV